MVIVRRSGQEIGVPPKRDPYAMEVDRGRNCYVCGEFRHLAHYCKNRERVAEERRLGYERFDEYKNSLKREENLGTFD